MEQEEEEDDDDDKEEVEETDEIEEKNMVEVVEQEEERQEGIYILRQPKSLPLIFSMISLGKASLIFWWVGEDCGEMPRGTIPGTEGPLLCVKAPPLTFTCSGALLGPSLAPSPEVLLTASEASNCAKRLSRSPASNTEEKNWRVTFR